MSPEIRRETRRRAGASRRRAAPPAPARGRPLRRSAAVALLLSSAGLWSTGSVDGQAQDARIPAPGTLWLELAPELRTWSEQFAANSDRASDGEKEPLFAHFDGSVASRLFPGPAPFLDDVNAAATELGYDAYTESDLSLGSLDFSAMNAQARVLGLGLELGIVDRLSVGFRAPFTMTDVESAFVFDSASATVTAATVAFPQGGAFFTEAQTALTSLQALIDGGSLAGMALTDAVRLRDDLDTFLTALEARSVAGGLIPTATTSAGAQMSGRFSGFADDLDALGIALPALGLPETATRSDLNGWLTNPPVSASPLTDTRNSLRLGEIEVSLRFNLFDAISDPGRDADADSASADAEVAGDSSPVDETDVAETLDPSSDGLRFRTTVGATLRLPILQASFPPLQDATHFLDVPIGDGQTDIELALYQDVSFRRFIVRSEFRYGIQRPDAVILRVAPPDQPFALEALQTPVLRDLGDYVLATVRPGFRLTPALSVALEWDYFRLGAPTYSLTEELADVADATALEVEGTQTRQRFGLGFVYDHSRAQDRAGLLTGTPQSRSAWQFAISMRSPISGSGGVTPSSFLYGASLRVPIGIF
ncbi:MAG: hypothetical protein MJB57_12815 [Gemmatimonadetes bacterium]|nr:hypothetical protein [Gemmatimonadota bacterium]